MVDKIRKVGILGGTFNPVHYGHLLLAESARDRLSLDKIIFIPTGTNPHKVLKGDIEAKDRYNMTKIAINNNKYFDISRIEIERKGYSYTIDTLEEMQRLYNYDDYYFITGADIIFEIDTWKKANNLLKKIKIVTTFRPGYMQENLDQRIKELKELYEAKIYKLHTPEMDISSSEIRSRIKHGYSIKYLLPEEVERYIVDKKLYL
ncbi:MAG: nicotinate-nucleotide adenylyltransferase [Eubacteriaceae bacterium]